MPHLDDDALALLALGEVPADADMTAHLNSCDRCRSELHGLHRVVTAGRANTDTGQGFVAPAPHVWAGVAAAVATQADSRHPTPTGGPTEVGAVTQLRPRAQRGRLPTWLSVAAGVVIGVSGAAAFQELRSEDSPPPEDTLVASAELDELGVGGTSGTAEIRESGDARVLEVTLADRTQGGGFREVWLLDPATGDLISLGVLNGTASTFELPDDLDLRDYPTVDVSREPLDGDPAHSSDSIARGDLAL
jgi:hypothetical protein